MSTMPMKNNFNLDGLLGNPALQIGLGILGANTPGATTGQAIGRGGMMGLQSLAQQQREAMMQKVRDEQIKVQQQRNSQIQSQMDLEAEQRAASKAALDNLVKDRPDLAPIAAIDAKAALKMAYPQANQSDPFFQAVPTDSGLGKFNARTGEFELVINPVTGKPYVKSSDSPALQGSIAGAKARETGNYKPSDMVDGQILTETQIAEMARGGQQAQQSNPWQIPPEVQAQRDAKARQLIASEGGQGNMGITPPMPYNLPTGGIKVPTKAEEAAQVEAAKDTAKAKTEANIELPQVVQEGEEAIKLIDEMIGSKDGKIPEHPGFRSAVGMSSYNPFNKLSGSDARAFNIRLDQIKGKQFLQAFQSLKGGGQITEIEGQKATEAQSRMNTATTEQEFIDAAREYQAIIQKGIDRARNKAGVSNNVNPATTPTKPPMKGQIIDGFKYKGGNPSDPNNWEEQ